jgi:chromate transporter
LSAALARITAAVVGVIANLGVYFATHTPFSDLGPRSWAAPPRPPGPRLGQPPCRGVPLLAALLFFRHRWSVLRTLGACALVGGAIHLIAA